MRSCMKPVALLGLITSLAFWGFGLVWADEGPRLGPGTLVVALDGTGDYVSLQEAVDAAKKGDTVFVKAGHYPQDVTIHSKEKIRFVGAGVDQVTILGRDIVVGALHVGKWPYWATDIEISDMPLILTRRRTIPCPLNRPTAWPPRSLMVISLISKIGRAHV